MAHPSNLGQNINRTGSAPPDEGQPYLRPFETKSFKTSDLASISEYVPSLAPAAAAPPAAAPAPAANPGSFPSFTPSSFTPAQEGNGFSSYNSYTPYQPPQPYSNRPQNAFGAYQNRPPPQGPPPAKVDSSSKFAESVGSTTEYVPAFTSTFKMQLETGAEFKPTEFKPSSAVETPEVKKAVPKVEKPASEDEGIENIELDGELSDEGISNVEIDVDFDEIETKKEEKKSPAPANAITKSVSIEDNLGSDDDEDGNLYNVENLTAKTVYQFEEFIKIGEVALTQEWEPEARIAYFRDRVILRIDFTYDQRQNFRDKRHRGGKRGPDRQQGFRRQITEDQKRILEEAKRIRERLKMPQPERVAAEKKARAILNKLTPQNFEKLRNQLFDICKESEDHTTDATNAIYVRACSGNKYTEMYAMLCSFLAAKQELFFGKQYKKNQFHRALLIICEEVFRKVPADEIETEEKIQLRKKAIGNMRFLGELYKKKLITTRIALEIISTLLEDVEDDKIEGACEFILSCTDKIAEIQSDKLAKILTRMDELKEQVSSRIKFRIMDLFDAKEAGWNVKKFEAGPNKIAK